MLRRSFTLCTHHTKLYINTIQKCSVHIHSFTRNMQLISNDKVSEINGLEVLDPRVNSRPLTLLYTWMLAKDKHVIKYSKFYLDRGIEVLRVRLSLFDLLRPTKGSQVVAEQMLQFLHANPNFGPLTVHGFSAGGYLFCESMVKVVDNMDLHGPLLKRFVGQIWDSVGDIYQIPYGLPRAVTSNEVLQRSMEKYLRWYMNFNYETATRHYERSSDMMHENTLNVPGLFIFSKVDTSFRRVCQYASGSQMGGKWKNYLIFQEKCLLVVLCTTFQRHWELMIFYRNVYQFLMVYTKCFADSPHVSHYLKYKREYEDELTAFLEKVGMLSSSKDRAVLS
ncbi:hypothetical protein Anas_05916 [Armadillidium nasatum]|uniref:Transmembrane protein 53 n=1 Tax=Armadillidium nasatum TaxID=96803 RepID=A0A5N5TBK9_9CRUS|nr:hypothetical protein Anas_05916 [Armadillidium nasatum]